MAETLTVNLSERSYTIWFGANLVEAIQRRAREMVATGARIAVIIDERVDVLHGQALRAAVETGAFMSVLF